MKNLLEPVLRIDLTEAFEEYDEKLKLYRDQILTSMDKVMSELQAMREEMTVRDHQFDRRLSRLESHLHE